MILKTDGFLNKTLDVDLYFGVIYTHMWQKSLIFASQTHSNIYRLFTLYRANCCVHPPVASLC